MPELSDLQDLIVRQFRDRRPRDLLVSAGAGSGKTFVLVESVLACLRAKTPLDRILVVTFTEKAASQVRNRIYAEMGKDPELASYRIRLPQAWISTIHSFCMRLLREHFDAAEVDPRFRVLAEEDARLLFDDAMTRVFHDGYSGAWGEGTTEIFEELVEMCGFDASGERLREVVRRLLEYARTSEHPGEFLARHMTQLRRPLEKWDDLPWRADYAARIQREWRTATGLVRALADGIDALGKKSAGFRAIADAMAAVPLDRLSDPAGQQEALRGLREAGLADENGVAILLPRLPGGTGDSLKKLKERAAGRLEDRWIRELPLALDSILAEERSAGRLALGLLDLTKRVWQQYQTLKERDSRLDFEDLQIQAHQLIEKLETSGNPIRFDQAFIDEYQDVNALQDRILSKVVDPLRIFRVGDIKQSIYQFRLASPEIIRGLASRRDSITKPANAGDADAWNVILPANYRSLPGVLELANQIASGLFSDEEIGSSYEEQRLVAAGSTSNVEHDAELLLIRTEDKKDANDEEGALEPKDAEYAAIGDRIRGLIEAPAIVRDPDTNEPRPVQYSDIAILLRAKSDAPDLARSLESRGIPVSLASGSSFFKATEVLDLLNLLRATDNLLDDIALAASLRSPAFGWSDAELLGIRLSHPSAIHLAFALALLADRARRTTIYSEALLPEDPQAREILSGPPATRIEELPIQDLGERAAAALDRFLTWRREAGRVELPALIARILDETALERSVTSMPDGLRAQGNLRKFLGISRRHARESGHDLHRFLRWVELLEEGGAKISEVPASSESVPAVRIMTIHGAKGLEFPVIFLAQLGRDLRLGASIQALAPGRSYIGVRLLDNRDYVLRQPIPLRLLLDQARADAIAEEKRVLYVALTRARDLLILTGVHQTRSVLDPTLEKLYRDLASEGGEESRSLREHLLGVKATPLAWILNTLPPIVVGAADAEVRIPRPPLRVRWIRPAPAIEAPPPENPIRAIEARLRALEPVEIPGGEDPAAVEAVEKARALPPLPSPGHLQTVRGKIWATEFKSGRGPLPSASAMGDEEEGPDEPAVPLIPSDAAREEGIAIHSLLERIDLAGLDARNLEERIVAVPGIDAAAQEVARSGLRRLLETPLAAAVTGASGCHREVAFGLRLPFLEVTRWLAPVREEILADPEWSRWVEAGEDGALRIRPGLPGEAGDPWVLIQGRIDLIARGGDGWIVLDWKSDRVRAGSGAVRRAEVYRGQMEIYRRAVESLFGSPVRTFLYFLRPGIIQEVQADA